MTRAHLTLNILCSRYTAPEAASAGSFRAREPQLSPHLETALDLRHMGPKAQLLHGGPSVLLAARSI